MRPAAESPACCRRLRSRGAYGRSADGSDFRSGTSLLEGYWCLATQEPVGPDDGLVHAQDCRPGRMCYESAPLGLAGGAVGSEVAVEARAGGGDVAGGGGGEVA